MLLLRFTRKQYFKDGNTVVDRLRKFPSVEEPVPKSFAKKYEVTNSMRDGVEVITICPPGEGQKYIIYLHGGAYIRGITSFHWKFIAFLVDSTKSSIVVPLYRKAPPYTVQDTIPLLTDLYRDVATRGPVILAGDSAGGGLALSLAQVIKKQGLQKPKQLLLISPWLDISLNDPAIQDVESDDPWLAVAGLRKSGEMWAGNNVPLADPTVSPLYGDLDHLVESGHVDIFIGNRDVLFVDCKTLSKKMQAGVRLYEYPGMFHVFPLFTFLPETKRAREQIREVLNE